MQVLYLLIEPVVKCVAVFACLMLSVAYLTWLERKVLGHIQIRFGPNRCGPFGLLQPFSDGIKAFFKEDLVPGRSDKAVFVLAPMISIIAAISSFAVIPFVKSIHPPWDKLGGQTSNCPGVIDTPRGRVGTVDYGLGTEGDIPGADAG